MSDDSETVTFDLIQKRIDDTVSKRNADEASHWFRCFQLMRNVDEQYFDDSQIEQAECLFVSLSDKTDSIASSPSHPLEILKRTTEEKQKAAMYLIAKIEQDKCNIDWASLLGQGTKQLPSCEDLKAQRIKILQKAVSI